MGLDKKSLRDVMYENGNYNPLTPEQEQDIIEAKTKSEENENKLGILEDNVTSQLAETVYYDEITHEKYRDNVSGTDYWITYVPNVDKDGNLIQFKHGFQNDKINSGAGETVRSFSNRHITSLTVNASIWNEQGQITGVQIQDGVIIQDYNTTSYTLGIKGDNTLVSYHPSVPATDIIADGCVNAITAFYPVIENGAAVDAGIYNTSGQPNAQNPRQFIAQMPNKDILFLTCDGRRKDNKGMTFDDVIRILLDKGVTFAYCLDGGGSAQTTVRGVLVNRPLDGNGFIERKVADFLYIVKPSENPQKFKTTSIDLGSLNKRITDLERALYDLENLNKGYAILRADEGFKFQGIEVWEGETKKAKLQTYENQLSYWDYINNRQFFGVTSSGSITSLKGTLGTFLQDAKSVTNIDTILESGFYWILSTATGNPTGTISYGILNIRIAAVDALQIAFPFSNTSTDRAKLRRTSSGVFGSWRDL